MYYDCHLLPPVSQSCVFLKRYFNKLYSNVVIVKIKDFQRPAPFLHKIINLTF